MPKRIRLSEGVVKKETAKDRDFQIFDDMVIGFALVVYRSGNKAFALNYRTSGRLRRYTIGRWPEWSVTAARARAAELRRQVDAGSDPMDERQSAYGSATISALVDLYQTEHLPKVSARNAKDQRSMLATFVLARWKGRLVKSITARDIDQLLTEVASGALSRRRWPEGVGKRPTPTRANRCGEVLRKMFSLAVDAGMRPDNPALNYRRREETQRDRFLSLDEVTALVGALDVADDPLAADLVRMLILTGARKGEVCNARFDDFSLDHLFWTKQAATTKQRRIHRVPISQEVASIIRRRRAEVPEGCPWLFPLLDGSAPVRNIERAWDQIRKLAGLEGLRLHDLRHTFASLLVSDGSSLEMIGGLLGHSNTRTTQRYAHLMDSPLRAGVDSVAARLKPRLRVIEGGG